MSEGFGRETSLQFFKPVDRRTEFLVISKLNHWVSHYDPKRNRSIRCGGLRCQLCAWGCKKQLRVVAMVIDGRGKEWLVEFRERHREVLGEYATTVGLRISIKREGTARNSPVTVRVIEEAYAIERDIARLVDHLGLEAETLDASAMESHPIPKDLLANPPEELELERNRWGND